MTTAMGGPIGLGTQYYTSSPLPKGRALVPTTSLNGLASASALAAANRTNAGPKSAPFADRVITAEVPGKIDDAGLRTKFSAYANLLKAGKVFFNPETMLALLEKLRENSTRSSLHIADPETRAKRVLILGELEPITADASKVVPLSQQVGGANPAYIIQSSPDELGTDKESMTSNPSVNETSVFSRATAWMSAQIEGMSDHKKMIIKVAAIYLIVAYGSSFFKNNNPESPPQL